MVTTTHHQPLEVAPWNVEPLVAWVAVPGIPGPPKRKMAFLARFVGRVVQFFPEIGFPELGARNPGSVSPGSVSPGSVSIVEKAELEKERAWTSAYFMGFMAPY